MRERMKTLRCYGGPKDGETVRVRYPGAGLFAPAGPAGYVRYERQRFRLPNGATVSVYIFGDPESFTQAVIADEHHESAYEQPHWATELDVRLEGA